MLPSHEATGLPSSPSRETVTPKNTVNTIRARMWLREMTSGKSPTVKVLTIWSPMLSAAAASATSEASIWMEVSTPKMPVTANI